MINNISSEISYSSTSLTAADKSEVSDEFINYLTEKFSNDDVPDMYQSNQQRPFCTVGDIGVIFGVEAVDGVVRLPDIQESVKQDLQSFQYMLDAALEEAGISKDPGFGIISGGSGYLHIDSEHPDKEKIEKILNETPNIRDTYQRMSANSSLLAACKRHEEFSKAYEIDPQSAVQQYSYLFENNPCDIFSIFVSEDGYKPSLNSYGADVDWEALVNPVKSDEYEF